MRTLWDVERRMDIVRDYDRWRLERPWRWLPRAWRPWFYNRWLRRRDAEA